MSELKDRRFSAEELELIVERAAVLQGQSDDRDSVSHAGHLVQPGVEEGMTLEAVREIATEVGVEPRYVEEAARSLRLDERPASSGGGLLGGPLRCDVGGTFPRQATDSARSELIDLIRGSTGHEGEVREVLDTVEWATVGRVTKTTVAIRDADGATDVRVRVDASGLAALAWVGSTGLGLLAGVLVIAVAEPTTMLAEVSMLGAGGALGLGAARAVWGRLSRSLRDRAQRLRDDVGRLLLR